MQYWQEDELQSLLSIRCEHQLFEALVRVARDLGFDFCAYGIRMPVPVSRPKVVTFSNYPVAWQERYREKNYLAVDPTVRHGMQSVLPIVWDDSVFVSARELWEDARSFGLHFGWAQSVRNVNGVSGLLTLARSWDPLTEFELQQKALKMAWFAQVAHLGMAQCLTEKLLPESEVQLTAREQAVLRWTADGKTSGDIADILGISVRTVNFHVNNAVEKLGVTNKLAAAVRAAVLGLVY